MFCDIHLRAISEVELKNLINNMYLEITFLKLILYHISQGPMS